MNVEPDDYMMILSLDSKLFELQEEIVNVLENSSITKQELRKYIVGYIDNELIVY